MSGSRNRGSVHRATSPRRGGGGYWGGGHQPSYHGAEDDLITMRSGRRSPRRSAASSLRGMREPDDVVRSARELMRARGYDGAYRGSLTRVPATHQVGRSPRGVGALVGAAGYTPGGHDVTSPISPTVRTSEDGTYGLSGVVHAAHSMQDSRNRNHTYLVACYTGTIDEYDRHEFWWDRDVSPHTEAEVYIELIGHTGRTSGEKLLVHAGNDADNVFQPGSIDEFAIACPDIGDIEAIQVRVGLADQYVYPDDAGDEWKRAMWKLDKVVVTCVQHSLEAQRPTRTRKHHAIGMAMCCMDRAKGDHAEESKRTNNSLQWHFVPPHARRWVGTKDPDGEDLEEAQVRAARPSSVADRAPIPGLRALCRRRAQLRDHQPASRGGGGI